MTLPCVLTLTDTYQLPASVLAVGDEQGTLGAQEVILGDLSHVHDVTRWLLVLFRGYMRTWWFLVDSSWLDVDYVVT